MKLDVRQQLIKVLDVHFLLLQLLPEDGNLGAVLLQVGPNVLLPGGGQLAPGEAGHPGFAKVGEHAATGRG